MLDAEALAEVTAEIVREHVAKSLAPVLEENGRLRERIAVLEAREAPAPDVSVIRALVDEAVAAIPPAAPGKDGQDFVPDMAELERILDESVARHMAEIERPKDGTSVTLQDVQPLIDEAVDKAVAAIPIAKDGVGMAGALIDRAGELIVTLTDGSTRSLGPVVGRDYDQTVLKRAVAEAVARIPVPKDGAPGRDADPTVIKQMVEEAVALIPVPKDGKDAYAGQARGLFDPDAEYRAMDVVSFNGCEWRAKSDNPGALPGDGWMLSAQRGKPGKQGDPGKPGLKGKDGASVIAGKLDAENMQMILARDDGEALTVDFYPLAEAIRTA
jgi:hypothetical protein